MASLRALSSGLRLATQRLACRPSSTVLTAPGAIFSRLNLINQTQLARFSSAPPPRITAFEQAMQEIYGDTWKQELNNRQKSYVLRHERSRKMWYLRRKAEADDPLGADPVDYSERRQPESEWRKKVEKTKMEIQWQKKLMASSAYQQYLV